MPIVLPSTIQALPNSTYPLVMLEKVGGIHHDGIGPPTTTPSRSGLMSIDNEGKVYASGDQIINVATHPTITTHTVGAGQSEWNMWRGAGLDSSLLANGYFQWNLNTHTLRQRRNGSRANQTWEEIVQYIEDESLGFPTGISAATVSLGVFDSEEDAALAAAHLTGFDLNTGTYIFIHEDVVGANHDFRLKRVLTYTAGATTPTDVLYWRPSPLTRREIFDLISEQANLHRPDDKPKQVSSIPTTEDEPVLNLTHDEYEGSGTADHQTVTVGDSAGLYGYSDGQALQQTFGTITGNSPVSFITGTGVGTGSSITSFTPQIVGSHNRGFVEDIRTMVIDGTDYTLSDLDYRYGAFRREIMSGPRITDGNFTFNFKDAGGNLYFTDSTTVANEAGLYWWDSSLSTPAYELLKTAVAPNEVQQSSATSFTSSLGRLQVTVDSHLMNGDILTFVAPSTISAGDPDTNVVLRTWDGSTNANQHSLRTRDGESISVSDLVAGRTYLIEQDSSNWVILTSLGELLSWAVQIDTELVPELNDSAISDARIVLQDSALTHYLQFLDWTPADISRINHLPVGGHIGLRQGVTTRILRVEAVWDDTNNRYQVINVNTGILSENASGSDTELLLTAQSSGETVLFGRGEPPAANADRVGLRFLDLTSKVLYGCFDDPHSTTSSTGDFDDISRSDIEINLNDRLEDIPVVEDEWLYRVSSNRFYAGTDVGASQLAWVDDTADDALAASLTDVANEVVWLGRHIDNEEALNGLTAIESGKEYFFYREADGTIVRLDNSSFTAAGSVVSHPFWFPVKADDREEHVFDARDGLPTLANDGSDDNRIGVTNDGVYIVDVDPISATDPTADSWADYSATDYEGAFASDPTIDTGHWYANYTRRTFREFESTNFGLGWIPHDAPVGFIGWYDSRQDALDHAAERGVADGANFVAFTGTTGTPKVETATNFTAATSSRIQRNWVFVSVGGSGGFRLLQGAGVPASSLGEDGYWYLNTTTGGWYEKVSGAWVLRYTDQVGAGGGLTQDQVDARISALSALLSGATFTGAVSGIAPTADAHFATKEYVDNNAGDVTGIDAGTGIRIDDGATATPEVNVRHDNTLQVDNSGDLGVNTQRVVQEVSEWVQHFATGDSHDTSGHSGKYQLYTSSNTHRRIGSVEYHFDPENDGGTRTFQVFILELTGQNVDAILGSSEVYSGDAQSHRFHFTDGVMINPNVRIGIGLHRTDGGNNEGLRVRSGNESQDSPRESYDDASNDFNFVGRFNHDRPTPMVSDTVGGTANGQIYGNPEIFYQIIHTHASLVGDGNVSAAHISSGSATADQPLLADGSSGAAFRDPVIHGGNLVDNTIPTAKYGNDSVTKGKLAANAKITANPTGTDGDDLTRLDVGGTNYNVLSRGVTHVQASAATYDTTTHTITVAVTGGNVRGGDEVLFVVPSNIGTSSTQAVSLEITGQSNSTHPLHDRNGDAIHEDDLPSGSVFKALSDANSWDLLVLPGGSSLTGTEIVGLLEALTGDDQLSYDFLSDTPADGAGDAVSLNRESLLSGTALAWADSGAAAGDASTTVIRFDRALTESDDGKLFSISARFDGADVPADSRFAFPDIDAKFIRALTSTTARSIWPGGGLPVASGSTPIQFASSRFWSSSGFAIAIWNLYYSGHLVGLLSSTAALGSTTLTVTSTTGLAADDYIYINSERIQITSVDSATQLTVPATTVAHTANSRLFFDDGRGFFFTQTHASQDNVADLEIDLVGGEGSDSTTNPRFNEVASADVITDGTTNWLWADTGIAKAGDNGWDQAAEVFQIELEQHSGVATEDGRALVTTGLIRKSEFNVLSAPDENNNMLPASANADDDAERYNVHMRETQSGGGLDMVIGRRSNGNIIIAGESGGHTYTVRVLSLEGGGGLTAEEEGQQSPEGVASLTAGYVHTLFYKYDTTEPSVHAANWRFNDEWSNTTGPPSDGWYDTAAEALTTAALNPSFVEADNTLWECRGRFRRLLNNDGDAYVYSDSKEVFAVFGEQFSEDGESWHGTQTDDDIWQRIRTDLGDWGTPTYIGTPGCN